MLLRMDCKLIQVQKNPFQRFFVRNLRQQPQNCRPVIHCFLLLRIMQTFVPVRIVRAFARHSQSSVFRFPKTRGKSNKTRAKNNFIRYKFLCLLKIASNLAENRFQRRAKRFCDPDRRADSDLVPARFRVAYGGLSYVRAPRKLCLRHPAQQPVRP